MATLNGLDGRPRRGGASKDAPAATPNLRTLLRRLFLVRPHESFLRACYKAPWRGLRGAVRRLKRLIPAGVKNGLRAAFLVEPGESFLRHFFKAPARYWSRRRARGPIINRLWPADRPMASVVIPCYNYGHLVGETIQSVLASTWKDLEILLVEGGSTDGTTPAVVRSLAGGRIRCFYQSRRCNESENRLLALKHVRGKYVLFLDADDLVDPTYIENAVYLLETTGVDMIVPDVRPFSTPEQLRDALTRRQGETWPTCGIPVPNIFENNYATVASMFRYSFWKEHKLGVCPINFSYAQDWYLWIRFACHGARYLHLPEAHHVYRLHSASISTSVDIAARNVQLNLIRQCFVTIRNDPARIRAAAARQAERPPVREPFVNLAARPAGAATAGSLRVMLCVPWLDQGGSSVLLGHVFTELARREVAATVAATNAETIDPVFRKGEANFLDFTPDCFSLQTCLSGTDKGDFLVHLARSRRIDVLLLVGSRVAYETLARLRREVPGLRVIDHLYNSEGHVGSNREFADLIDFHIVAHEGVRETLIGRGEDPDKIRVIPHGIVVPPGPREAGARRPFTFGFLGRLSEEKRPCDVVEAARRLPDARFLLAGDGPMRDEVAAAVQQAGIAERLHLAGYLPTNEGFYEAIDALVIPSRTEGLPIVLLEAMGRGIPVVAARVGMIGQVVTDGVTGLTYPSGDLDALERACHALMALSPDDRARMGVRARQVVLHHHTVERCAEQYLDVFRRVGQKLYGRSTVSLQSAQLFQRSETAALRNESGATFRRVA
jgi:O-antigen biosynthesis protein